MEKVRTGDVLLFSSNTATGFLLKTFTSSKWNHVGAAVRLGRDGRISLNYEGRLYILELNSGRRYDVISDSLLAGLTLTEAEWVVGRYNLIAMRKLKGEFRNKTLTDRIGEFLDKHHGTAFSPSFLPFIGVWLGLPLAGDNRTGEDGKPELFCSEMLSLFYEHCVGTQIKGYEKGNLESLFGGETPSSPSLYLPGHFSIELTKKNPIFEAEETEVYISHVDIGIILIQPILLILFIAVVIGITVR